MRVWRSADFCRDWEQLLKTFLSFVVAHSIKATNREKAGEGKGREGVESAADGEGVELCKTSRDVVVRPTYAPAFLLAARHGAEHPDVVLSLSLGRYYYIRCQKFSRARPRILYVSCN